MSKQQATHKWLQGERKNEVNEGTKLSQTYVTFKYPHPWCKSLQKQASEASKGTQSLVFLMYKLHPVLCSGGIAITAIHSIPVRGVFLRASLFSFDNNEPSKSFQYSCNDAHENQNSAIYLLPLLLWVQDI